MTESMFGRIRHAGEAENAVRVTLQKWLHTFLTEVERQNQITPGQIERPRGDSYFRTTDPQSLPNHSIPAIAIEGTGPVTDPQDLDGAGTVTVAWGVSVTVYAKGKNRDDALDNARMIGAAIRATLAGKPSLEGFASDVWWIDEDFGVLEASRERTMAGCEEVFGVQPDGGVMRYGAGPNQPDPDPDPVHDYGEHPTAESVQIDDSILDQE
jgi:hypothetical protein